MLDAALGYLSGATTQLALVAASSGPGCAWEGPSCVQGLAPKALWDPPPPPEVAWSSSRALCRKTVEWTHTASKPQGTSSIVRSDQGREDGAGGSPVWGQCGQAFNGGKVVPTPEPQHLVSAWVSVPDSPRRSTLLVQVGYSLWAPPQEQAQQARTSGSGRDRSNEFPIGKVAQAELAEV